jgi:hypothetical protein
MVFCFVVCVWLRIRGAVGLSHSLIRGYPKSVVRQAHSASNASLGATVEARSQDTLRKQLCFVSGILIPVFKNLCVPTSLIRAIGLAYNRFRVLPYEGVGQTDSADKAKPPPETKSERNYGFKRLCQRHMVIYGYK